MSVFGFIKKLSPNFDRSNILEDIGQQKEYLNDTLIPNLRNTAKTFGGRQLASDYGRTFLGNVQFALPQYRSRGPFNGLAELFGKVAVTLQQIEALAPELFQADVTKETLTYQRAIILKYLSGSRFAARYAAQALSALLTAETAEALQAPADSYLESQLTKFERDWLSANAQQFTDALKALNHEPHAVIESIKSIPDVTADESKERVVNQTIGLQKLDPLRLGFLVPSYSNPFYTLRMWMTEWKHANYKASVEEARVLELKILELKQALGGTEDAKTQRALDYTKGRLDKLRAAQQEYEERGS